MALTDKDTQRAAARVAKIRRRGYAVEASYDPDRQRLVVLLHTGVELSVPVRLVQELHAASAEALSEFEITPSGLGLHWPRLDADIYVPGLLKGVFGTRRWMRQLRQLTDDKGGSFIEALASMPNVGEDADFERTPPHTRDFRETARERVLRDPHFADSLAREIADAQVTPSSGNVFLDLGFPPDEAERLLAETDQRIAAEIALRNRDGKRDIGAELLEAVRLINSGIFGTVHGPPGTLVLRCIDLSPLGELTGDDLSVGTLYVGRLDREGWVRVTDKSGEDYLYPLACFEELGPTKFGETTPQVDHDA